MKRPMMWRSRKYNNVRTSGYASKLEAADAMWLRQLEQTGGISDLEEQVRYDFVVNGKTLRHYARVDFRFKRCGKTVWYETKGFPTDMWRLKKEIIEATLPDDAVYMVNGTIYDILAIKE